MALPSKTAQALNIGPEHLDLRPMGEGRDPYSRLLGVIAIAGVNHHVNAIAVEPGQGDFHWVADNSDPHNEVLLEGIYLAAEPDEPFATIRLHGREYVMFIEPCTA